MTTSLTPSSMDFSEANGPWRGIPHWASFLVELGFNWLPRHDASRRIALISMPCDSAAAGLIALGAMRKCLEVETANDARSHHERLLQLAKKPCPGVFLRHASRPGRYEFDGFDSLGNPMVARLPSKTSRANIPRENANHWQIIGEAPVAILHGQQVPNSQFYTDLVKQGSEIKLANLSYSHSEICLAGRGAGEAPTKGCIAEVRFRKNGSEVDLSQLLTIQSWMPGTISRVIFYNARTAKFDRQARNPQVVIADGDVSFLKVIDESVFDHSDIVGVIHRTTERDKLEAVGTKLENLRQWYDREESLPSDLHARPRGVAVALLRRKS